MHKTPPAMDRTKLYEQVATPFEALPPGTPGYLLQIRHLTTEQVEVVTFAGPASHDQSLGAGPLPDDISGHSRSSVRQYRLIKSLECGQQGQ